MSQSKAIPEKNGLAQLLTSFSKRQLKTLEDLMDKSAKFLDRDGNSRKVTLALVLVGVGYYYLNKNKKKSTDDEDISKDPKKKRRNNEQFVKQLKTILPIVLPGIRSKEFSLLALHTGFLVFRTFLSIYVAKLDGSMVKSLVDRDGWKFIEELAKWIGIALPATYVNSMIKYLESKLAIAFRTRLSQYSYQQYMQTETYYRVGNLDSRISNADQCLTEDISKFSSMLAHLHSQLSKPILDVVLMTWQLLRLANQKGKGGGLISGLVAAIAIWTTARVLKYIQPPFGRMAAQQAKLEGDTRFVHSRLITNAEEIAFYRGHKVEESILMTSYLNLVKHMNDIFRRSIVYNMMEGFFMKYIWSAAGSMMIAIPAFFFEKRPANATYVDTISTRTQDYITSKKLLMSGAEAIERLMLALKEVNEFAGYTSRVYEMISVFRDVQKGNYVKTQVAAEQDGRKKVDLRNPKGVLVNSEFIKFEDVPVVSPNGDVLVEKLSFEVKPGMHLLITGPNGCGKSSLFRILGGLWPVAAGTLFKPDIKHIFYIPQRPYLPIGNLRDQVIYPDTITDMKAKGLTDKYLEELLSHVNLTHILEREKGWEAVQDWKDVLSGGEKQRIGMARLFYHKPKYAILDECTSAVSIDVEGKMYSHAIDSDITLLTVTHRPSLWKYHNYILQFDGEGGYHFGQLNADVRMSLKEEKSKLESQLSGIPKMQARLKELCQMLGEDSVVLQEN